MSSAAARKFAKFVKSSLIASLFLAGLAAFAPRARAADIDFDSYAAVAYSPSTGTYGYAWNYWSLGDTEQVALSHCTAEDAKIVGWVKGGWLVLAVGDGNAYGVGWEYGDGATNTVAAQRAIDECHSRDQKVKVIVCVCSGDIDPQVIK